MAGYQRQTAHCVGTKLANILPWKKKDDFLESTANHSDQREGRNDFMSLFHSRQNQMSPWGQNIDFQLIQLIVA